MCVHREITIRLFQKGRGGGGGGGTRREFPEQPMHNHPSFHINTNPPPPPPPPPPPFTQGIIAINNVNFHCMDRLFVLGLKLLENTPYWGSKKGRCCNFTFQKPPPPPPPTPVMKSLKETLHTHNYLYNLMLIYHNRNLGKLHNSQSDSLSLHVFEYLLHDITPLPLSLPLSIAPSCSD